MKFFIIVFLGALLSTRPALAGNKNTSASHKDEWQTIQADKDLMVAQPDFAEHMGPNGIFNVCKTDNELRTISPINVCNEYAVKEIYPSSSEFGPAYDFNCLKESPGHVVISRTNLKSECEKSVTFQDEDKNAECLIERAQEKIPEKITLEVVRARGEAKGQSVFAKEYIIPSC